MAAHADELGPALSFWNDYVGTAAADEPGPTIARASLYELAGLDPAAWIILSVDLDLSGPSSSLVVYAVDRRVHGVSSHADLVELGHQAGELPVTAFELVGAAAQRFGAAAFERLSVRLVARPFHDQRLVVQARRSLPGPPDETPSG